jgi:hypothetical protein
MGHVVGVGGLPYLSLTVWPPPPLEQANPCRDIRLEQLLVLVMPSTITSTALSYRWQILSTAFLLYLVARAVYRLFFHPLAKVPGPPLAAITKLYQSYYNRKYYEQVDKLHQIYGPVVRINPDEVHLSDPDNYDKIYFIGSKYSKGTNYYASTSVPHSTFGAISNEV